jgi:hypothetical protein
MNDKHFNALLYVAIAASGMLLLIPGVSFLYSISVTLIAMVGIYYFSNASYQKVEFVDVVKNTGISLGLGLLVAVLIYAVGILTALENFFK